MGWVQLSSLVRPKRHGTACAIGPKGEARTHGTACAIGPKGKARTFELRASSGYLTPSNGYIGFPYYPLVRPERHRTHALSVPKAKLGHTEPRATSVPKAKLGHTEHITSFRTKYIRED